MTAREFKGLEEITVNGQEYVNKRELLQLIRDEKNRCKEAKEPGYLYPKKKHRLAAVGSLNHLAVLINKKFYDELHETMFKYIIASPDGEDGVLLYLRGWCKHVPGEEGNAMPVFTEDSHEAVKFDEREDARAMIQKIRGDYPKLELAPVQYGWTRHKGGLRMIHAMFGWPKDRDPEDLMADELIWHRELA